MQPPTRDDELRDRLNLIETMIVEGRRSTESWGWTFVLWGVAYMIAMAWAAWGRSAWAWPLTTVAAVIVTIVGFWAKNDNQPETTMGRAVLSIWIALGISMFVLFAALGLSGRLADPRLFVAVVSAILGLANGASGMILRWKVQLACALVWWATAAACCFGTETQGVIEFLVAIFLCQIVFGIYGMVAQSRERGLRGPSHA